MTFRRREPRNDVRRSQRRMAEVDVLEGRVLLSTAALGHATRPRPMAQIQRVQQVGVDGQNTPQPGHATLGDQIGFAYNTYHTGQEMVASPQVRDVGLKYAKLSVSHDTRKVGAAYLGAAIRGDGKDLERLGKTPLVKKVANDFEKLSESPMVKKVGDAFASFGKSVAKRFNQLFNID